MQRHVANTKGADKIPLPLSCRVEFIPKRVDTKSNARINGLNISPMTKGMDKNPPPLHCR